MLYSSGGRPATALSPMLGISLPSYTQTSVPSARLTLLGACSFHFAGRWLSNMPGGSTTWSSTLTRIRSSSCMRSPPVSLTTVSGYLLAMSDKPALVLGDRALTFGQLDERSDRLAAVLEGMGAVAGRPVVAVLPNCFEFFEVSMAAA